MASSLLFLLAIGGAYAARMVAIVQHPPDSFDRHQRAHCDSMSSKVNYLTENFCTDQLSDQGSFTFQCVGSNVMSRYFTDKNCQSPDPNWNVSNIMSGCVPGFPVSNFYSCVDTEYIQPTSFNQNTVFLHYNYNDTLCSNLEYVTAHRMNTCYMDATGRFFQHTCAANGNLNVSVCQDPMCQYGCQSTLIPPSTSCKPAGNTGDIYYFTCPSQPPPPPSTTFLYGQIYASGATNCGNQNNVSWVNGFSSGSCVFFSDMGHHPGGGPMYGRSLSCPATPDANASVTMFMDNLCTWPWGSISFPLGCDSNPKPPMTAPIQTSCASVNNPPWDANQYYFRQEYDSTCTNLINTEGRRYAHCYQSLEWPNQYWKHVCNVAGFPNAVVSYNCTDAGCNNCQMMDVEPILDFCDFRNTKVSAPDVCKSYSPPPPPSPPFYALSSFYTTPQCTAYSVWSVARQGSTCNKAGNPFGHGGLAMPEWITYNQTHILRTIFADYQCQRQLFSEADPLGCGQSRFDNQMAELRQQQQGYTVPYKITNASYPTADCSGQPDLVDLIEQNVCNPVVGGFPGPQQYIQFTCANGIMTGHMCPDPTCSSGCGRNFTSAGGCVSVGGGRSFQITCAAQPLPPPPPPKPTPPGPPVPANPGGPDDWRKKRHEAEVIPIGIITGIAGIAVIVLTISGYRKLRAGGYSEL